MTCHSRLLTRPAALLALGAALLCGGPASFGQTRNLLDNGGLDAWNDDDNEPIGWHTRLISIIPVPEYEDSENKDDRTGVVHFKCGCGHDWGTVRPWTNLVCPQCRRMNTGLEDSGDLYLDNEEYVAPVRGRRGRAAGIDMPPPVGNNEGVRIISRLIRADGDAGYEISFDTVARGAVVRVFVEGFRLLEDDKEAAEWAAQLPAETNPLGLEGRLKRVFRKHINAGSPGQWRHFSERFVAPERYRFDYLFVTLYAYMPGQAAFDNVVLRQLTPRERAEHLEANPPPRLRMR